MRCQGRAEEKRRTGVKVKKGSAEALQFQTTVATAESTLTAAQNAQKSLSHSSFAATKRSILEHPRGQAPYNGSGQYGVTVLGIEVALRVKYDGYDDSVLLPAEFVQMGSPSARQGTTTDVVTDTGGSNTQVNSRWVPILTRSLRAHNLIPFAETT
jgi:hypothetical protein